MPTTAKDIYKAACRLIYETPNDDDDLKSSFPDLLEICLFEALPYENNLREVSGRPVLRADDIPKIATADDDTTVLPFDERILRLAVKYGVKSGFLEDDNSKKAESVICWNKFVDTLAATAPATFERVKEWGDDGE